MGKMHSLHAHHATLPRAFKHIYLESLLLHIENCKEKFFKITVISAMNQDSSLAFAFWYHMHYRKLNILIGYIKPLDPRTIPFKKICIVFIKKFCSLLIIFLFIRVTIIHKELAHSIISNGIPCPPLFHGSITETYHFPFPVRAVMDPFCDLLNIREFSAIPVYNAV